MESHLRAFNFFRRNKNESVSNYVNPVDQALDEVMSLSENTNLVQMDKGRLWELVGSVREQRDNRIIKYQDYEEMTRDPLIQSAMELLCDDATQVDIETNHVAWVVSNNKKLEAELNAFLHQVVDVDTRLWSWAFDIIKYGETFLRTYATNPELSDKWIFEQVRNPQAVSHIVHYGEDVGYIYDEPSVRDTNISQIPLAEPDLKNSVFPPEEFIHFLSDRSNNRADIFIKIGQDTHQYKVVYGSSFIEPARPAYQIIRLLEDVLILARIARSTMYRLVKVNVGKADPKTTKRIIQEVRQAIKHREYLDLGSQMYKSEDNPIAVNDHLFFPVQSDGIGDIQVEMIGEDVNVNAIVDIDYFKNKLFAALKVPKAFLGFEDQMPSSLGASSLTRVDVRYARTVKRIQNVLRSGIRSLCNYYLDRTKQSEYKMSYDVKMARIVSSEDNAITQDLFARINTANAMINMFDNTEYQEFIDKAKFVAFVVDKILGLDFSLFAKDPSLADLATDPNDPPSRPVNPVAGYSDDSVDTGTDNSYNIQTRFWNFGDPY